MILSSLISFCISPPLLCLITNSFPNIFINERTEWCIISLLTSIKPDVHLPTCLGNCRGQCWTAEVMNPASKRETGQTTHWHWHNHVEVSLRQLDSWYFSHIELQRSVCRFVTRTHTRYNLLEETTEQNQWRWDSSSQSSIPPGTHRRHLSSIAAKSRPVGCKRAGQWVRKFDYAAIVLASHRCPALLPHGRPQSLLPWIQAPTPLALKPILLLPWLRIALPIAKAKDSTPVVNGEDLNSSFLETPPLVAMAADGRSCCHGCKYSQCYSNCRAWIPCCNYYRPHPLFPW